MARVAIPFNITLLNLTPEYLKMLSPITDLSIFDSNKDTYSSQGLFSNEIFGEVGTELRNKRFAYIDIKLPVLHPIVYKALTQARKMYIDIISGSQYATFSYKDNDFIKSDPIEGETGYHFFFKHYPQLLLQDTGSDRRRQTIELLNKFRDRAIIDKIIVLPAGLRDVEFEDNRPTYDEINNYYKRLISLSNNISPNLIELDPSLVDKTRFKIQETFNELYENLSERIEGKKKLFLGKWASRRIFNGTRNVITAQKPSGRYLGAKENVGYNDTVVGLYQFMKSILPLATYCIQNSLLQEVLQDPNYPVQLLNKETWQIEECQIDSKIFDYYRSAEGIEQLITDFQYPYMVHKPISIIDKEGIERYVFLTYLGKDDTVRIFRDIRELPEGYKREDCHPTTYIEFLYYTIHHTERKVMGFTVRYPITNPYNVRSTSVFLKSTVKDEVRYWLDDNWNKTDIQLRSFPVLNEDTHNSQAVPLASLAASGADFDEHRPLIQ